MIEVPTVVRNKARETGAEVLAGAVADACLEPGGRLVDRSRTPVRGRHGGLRGGRDPGADGTTAVLKVLVPRTGNDPSNEATVLRLVGGDGCPVLYWYDPDRGALLLERPGRPMYELGLPSSAAGDSLRHRPRIWRPAPRHGLPDGGEQGPMARRLHRDVVGGARPSRTGTLSTMPWPALAGGSRRTATRGPCWSTATCTN